MSSNAGIQKPFPVQIAQKTWREAYESKGIQSRVGTFWTDLMSLRVYLSNEANQGGKVGEGKGTGERQANGETRGKCLGKWSEISPIYCMISMIYIYIYIYIAGMA